MNPQHVDGLTRFEFRGEADAVRLATFMPRFPKDIAFRKVETGLFRLDLYLPEDARIEYLIDIERHGHRHAIRDPANPDEADNPFGANSVATGPGYQAPPWTGKASPPGTTTEIRVASRTYGGRRHHHVYTPAGHDYDSDLPLLVVHDGTDYVRHAGLVACIEWMIATGTIPPLRLLLLQPRARHEEYVASGRHAAHVTDEVIPHVQRRMGVRGPLAVMGASLGAVAAWHLAHEAAGQFDLVLLQSGTYSFDSHHELSDDMHSSISRFVTAAEHHTLQARVAMSCGRYESLIDWNRRVARSFKTAGVPVAFVEAWAGHDWGAWADRLAGAFSFLYEPARHTATVAPLRPAR